MLLVLLACATSVDFDGDGVFSHADCDDDNAARYPGALEVCDGVDNDCDGHVDFAAVDALVLNWDGDSDGLGDPHVTREYCQAQPGWVDNADDCDDADFFVGPGELYYYDADGLGCGDQDQSLLACEPPPYYVDQACGGQTTEGGVPSTDQLADLDPAGASDLVFGRDGAAYVSSVTDDVDGVWRITADGAVEALLLDTRHNIDAIALDDRGDILAAVTGRGLYRLLPDGPQPIRAFDTPKGENWHNAHHNRFASSIAWDTHRGCTWVPNVDTAGNVACLDESGVVDQWVVGAYVESVAVDDSGQLWISMGSQVYSEGTRSYSLPATVLDMVWTARGLVVETTGYELMLCDQQCTSLGGVQKQAKLAAHPDGGVVRMASNPVQDASYAIW